MDAHYTDEIKVLVVEDDEDDWLIIKKIFGQIERPAFNVEWCSTYAEGLKKVREGAHDAYLLDYRLGEHTGTDILRKVDASNRAQPFVLLTGATNYELERKSLELAAADYLVKGSFDATLLSRTLLYALQRKRIEQQRIDELIELNKAKDEFISIASHQLRTPATSVKQYLGMVLEGFVGELPKDQRSMLYQAYESNERQLRVIADLLKVAQVDSGKLRLHPRKIDISKLLKEIVADERQIAREREQKISFKPLSAPLKIDLDRDVFWMVFENIIDNAGKYSHKGSTIRVEINDLGHEICVGVIDQGVGIDQKEIGKLYGKFVRINNSLSTKVGGTGLGLYWAKRIVDLHGGRIEYRPNRPSGSKFLVCLPKTSTK